jgi:hypothetical protein
VTDLHCPRLHLISGIDTALNILILRKETLTINTPSPQVKLKLLAEFQECIYTATNRKLVQLRIAFVDLNRAFQSSSGQEAHNRHHPFQTSRDQSPHLFRHHHQMEHLVPTLVALEDRQCICFRLAIASTQTERDSHPHHELNQSIPRNVGPLLAHPNRWRNGHFHQNSNFRMGLTVLYGNSHPTLRIHRGRRQLRKL